MEQIERIRAASNPKTAADAQLKFAFRTILYCKGSLANLVLWMAASSAFIAKLKENSQEHKPSKTCKWLNLQKSTLF